MYGKKKGFLTKKAVKEGYEIFWKRKNCEEDCDRNGTMDVLPKYMPAAPAE